MVQVLAMLESYDIVNQVIVACCNTTVPGEFHEVIVILAKLIEKTPLATLKTS